ncbi:MAG TPA: hypothetical protein VMZ29_15980 [Candidatus Bathyarchaeia archaeon]|nr:hypothetical protein [Candidatus Bathyarchaeia archaeon]
MRKLGKSSFFISLTILLLVLTTVNQAQNSLITAFISEKSQESAKIDYDVETPINFDIYNEQSLSPLTPKSTSGYNYSLISEFTNIQITNIYDLAIQNNLLFIASYTGLFICNFTIQSAPILNNQPYTNYQVRKILIENDLLYYLDGSYNIITLNISNVNKPILLSQLYIGQIENWLVSNSIIIVTTSISPYQIKIYDYQDPANPCLISSLVVSYSVYDLVLWGSYLICSTYTTDLYIIDILDINNPFVCYTKTTNRAYFKMQLENNLLYLFETFYFSIYYINSFNNLSLIDSINVGISDSFFVDNNLVFITNHDDDKNSLDIYNITNPSNIELLIKYDNILPPTNFNDPMLTKDNLFVIGIDNFGILFYDFTNVTQIVKVNHIFTGLITGLHYLNNYLIVEISSLGFIVLDLSNLTRLEIVYYCYINNMIKHMTFSNNLGYIASSNNYEIFVFNFTIPSEPKLVASYIGSLYPIKILAKDQYLIIHDNFEMNIIDFSNITNPIIVSQYSSPHQIIDFVLGEDVIYLITYYNQYELIFINVTDIINPATFRDIIIINNIPKDMEYSNGSLCVLCDPYYYSSHCIYIYNVTAILEPLSVVNKISYYHNHAITDLGIKDNYLFVSDDYVGLTVFYLDKEGIITISGKLLNYESVAYSQIQNIDFIYSSNITFLLTANLIVIVGSDKDNDFLADYLEINVYHTDPNSADTDMDLMLDWYEIKYNLDPLNATDAMLDLDFDNLLNYEEAAINTNPNLADTDQDNLRDDLEIYYGTNPLDADTDDDGLYDSNELFTYYTDPLDSDSDNDLLSDGNEVNIYHTNPLSTDTDSDLMDDRYEVIYDLNPLIDDRYLDLDVDGLTNYEEYLLGTAPNRSDTDYDGYTDFEEIQAGTDPLDRTDYPDSPLVLTESAYLPFISIVVVGLFASLILSRKQLLKSSRRLR